MVETKWVTRDEYYNKYRYWGKDRAFYQFSAFNKWLQPPIFDCWDTIPKSDRRHESLGPDKEERKITIDHYAFKPVFNHQFPVFQFNSVFIPAGQYSFPISFTLPKGMGATFNHEWTEEGKNCFADVRYNMIVSLDAIPGVLSTLRNERLFVVNQAVTGNDANKKSNTFTKVNSCCVGKGQVNITAYFEKENYAPGDTAYVVQEIDNSGCQVAIKTIDGVFKQTLRLTAGSYTKTIVNKLNTVKISGIAAGAKLTGEQAQRIEVKLVNKDSGKEVQPTCKGTLIKNNYTLEQVTKMDAIICCAEDPKASIALNMFNKAIQVPAFVQPPSWTPQVMNPFVCNFSSDFKMNVQMPQVNVNMNMGGGNPPPQNPNNNGMANANVNMNVNMGLPNVNMTVTTTTTHSSQHNNGGFQPKSGGSNDGSGDEGV